jgi:molybdenum cofactor biosynthesis enzyme MoaA
MKNYCPLPFSHTYIGTNGSLSICCLHNVPQESKLNIKNTLLNDWLSSDYLKSVQESFKNDEKHFGCQTCWLSEKEGVQSLRNKAINEYRLLGGKQFEQKLIGIELQLGNLCNLGCLMCSPVESSYILSENIKLGLDNLNKKDFKWNTTHINELKTIFDQDIRLLNVRGGEPLLNKQLLDFCKWIPKEKANKMILQITTNATVWNTEWEKIISKFRLVRFMFSIDATDKLYEYIRFPAKWKNTKNNIIKMMSYINVRPMINCVVQNLNVANMQPLLEFAIEHNLHIELTPVYGTKEFLRAENLPDDLKFKAVNNLKKLQQEMPNYIQNQLIQYINLLENKEFDSDKWKQFLHFISLKDQNRKTDYTQFLN